MFISRKRWKRLEKRIADLEKKVQDQPLKIIEALTASRYKELTKSSPRHQRK